jgi:hypothetical protein
MILYNFPKVREYTIKRLFIPYCVFVIVFATYMNIVFEDKDNMPLTNLIYEVLLFLFASYYLQNETAQLSVCGIDYLKSLWNYIDIIPPTLIYMIIAINLSGYLGFTVTNSFLRSVHAIASFFMWFKLLYFMRIFRNTSYLIRMIITVIYDMRSFLLLLFITIIAFGDSWLSISLGNVEEEQFVHNFGEAIFFTYRVILGDFDTTAFGSVAVHLCLFLFIICTVLNMIVMLNLLIAIISESFAAVNEKSDNASYQEMASMICENSYLIPYWVKEEYNTKDKYLLVVTDYDKEQAQTNKDPVLHKLISVKKKLMARFDNLDEQLAERKAFEE